jgi:hypothetical protein
VEEIEKIRIEMDALNQRLAQLEQGKGLVPKQEPIEVNLTMPKLEGGGLQFNRTKISAVFDLKEDGWWHSRDILFMSARNVRDDKSRDILTEYLESVYFRDCLAHAVFGVLRDRDADFPFLHVNELSAALEVSLPIKSEGAKKYNGADSAYWLKDGGDAWSNIVCSNDFISVSRPSSVSGVALMFRINAGVNNAFVDSEEE